MNKKIAFALVPAAFFVVAPAFAAEGETKAEEKAEIKAENKEAKEEAHEEHEAHEGHHREWGNPHVLGISSSILLPGASLEGAPTDVVMGAGFSMSTVKPANGDSTKITEIKIAPAVDYFVIEGLSIGGFVGLGIRSVKEGSKDPSSETSIAIGPRVGYNFWLSPESLSLWPQLGFVFQTTSLKTEGKDVGSASKMAVVINVPLLIHPAKHFHFGVGPYLMLDVSSKFKDSASGVSADGPKATTFGLVAEIAGWL